MRAVGARADRATVFGVDRIAGDDLRGLTPMSGAAPNLRVLDRSSAVKELDLASELFHRINRILPPNQILLTADPSERVRDVIGKMDAHGYSQIPIVRNGEVLGVFSYRSFARAAGIATLDRFNKDRCAPGDLPVDEFIEQFEFARVTEELPRVFDAIDRDNGILVGTPEKLVGILTPMDFLRYLYSVAGPFVLVSEIELAVRALIRQVLAPDEINSSAQRLLVSAYGTPEKVPGVLEEMSFDNYRMLLTHGDTWPAFEPLLGGTPARVAGKLKEVGAIRNDLFHFKRTITLDDHQTLALHRNWFLNKIKQAGPSQEKGAAGDR